MANALALSDPQDAIARAHAALDPEQARKLQALPAEQQHILDGIALWLCGNSYRYAAKAVGVSHVTLHRWVKALEIAEDDRNALANLVNDQSQRLAVEIGRQVYERVTDPNEKELPLPQLAVLWGIAVDKVARFEQIRQNAEKNKRPDALDPTAIFDQLRNAGSKASLTVTVTTEPDAIDVTPEEP